MTDAEAVVAFRAALREMQQATWSGTLGDVERAWGRAYLALEYLAPARVDGGWRYSDPRTTITRPLDAALWYARGSDPDKVTKHLGRARRAFVAAQDEGVIPLANADAL